MKPLDSTKIKKPVLKLVESKPSYYSPIYSPCLVELEIFKMYIETPQKLEFIRSSKSHTKTSILFDKKLNRILYPYVDY